MIIVNLLLDQRGTSCFRSAMDFRILNRRVHRNPRSWCQGRRSERRHRRGRNFMGIRNIFSSSIRTILETQMRKEM